MRIAMVLLTRDQVDLVDAVVAFHLHAGVDIVLALDHESTDGTAEILRRYEKAGVLRLFHREGTRLDLRRPELARLAAEEHGADWVLHPDGDEFWWPRRGSWRELLREIPDRYGVIRGAWRHFAPRPGAGHFAERLTLRVAYEAPQTGQELPFHPGVKVVHRADPRLMLAKAAHDAELPGRRTLRGWYPFEILHFPLRTAEQSRGKYLGLAEGLSASGLHVPPHVERASREIAAGSWDERYADLVVDDAGIEEGLRCGSLELDTRLRDALRVIAGVPALPLEPRFPLPGEETPPVSFEVAGVEEEARYARDVARLEVWEGDTRVLERLDALERRARLPAEE